MYVSPLLRYFWGQNLLQKKNFTDSELTWFYYDWVIAVLKDIPRLWVKRKMKTWQQNPICWVGLERRHLHAG